MRAPVRFSGCSCCCRGEKRCACVRGCVHARAKPSKAHKCAAHRFTPSRAPTTDVAIAAGCVACASGYGRDMCRSTDDTTRTCPNTTYDLCTATRALSGVSTHWPRRHSLSAVRSTPGVAQSLQQSRRRCGSVLVQMWASPGADVGESRRRCGSVRVQLWAQSRRRCGRVPAQMWAEPDCLRTYCRRLLARTRAVETTALTTQTHRRRCAHRRRRRRRADPRRS